MTKQKGQPRTAPQRSPHFGHLTLEALRQYRGALREEEGRVSYWRRIVQARLDTVRSADAVGNVDYLRPMLAESRVSRGRIALIEVVPVGDIPPLLNLQQLWDRTADPVDDAARAALVDDLAQAETQLSAYRTALHRRLASATDELIARYRDDPALCLSVLPLQRGQVRTTA